MSPADNTPDFDSMSPEELMAWMETLAERQGASEGFTTDQRMDIAEVDPSAVEDTGPGYIPSNMTEEQWAEVQAKEAAEKAARVAAKAEPVVAEPVIEEPAPEPIAEVPVESVAAGDTPDFDSMSPEELMAWMETLAERQGASEGFTTDQRMDIAEVDPSTVEDTGPGYIPSNMTEEQWAEVQAKEAAEKAARAAAAPEPVIETPTEQELVAELLPEFDLESEIEPAALPDFELPGFDMDLEATTEMTPAVGDDSMAWLESLAAGQEGDDFPQMDLSGLGDDLAELSLEGLPEGDSDPEQWLESLAQEQQEMPFDLPTADITPPEAAPATEGIADPTEADVDPIEWLESLAVQEGVDPEELTTEASLDVPATSEASATPDFDFSSVISGDDTPDFDAIDALDTTAVDADDPVAWLDNLASSQGVEGTQPEPAVDLSFIDAATPETEEVAEAAETEDIMAKLNQAQDVSASDMKSWMDNLLEQGASRTDVPDYIEEEDEEETVIEAQIPDWLLDQVGAPPDLSDAAEAEVSIDLDALAASVADEEEAVPDWLQTEIVEEEVSDLDSVFSNEEVAASIGTITDDIEIDTDDPWVEAFELERTEGLKDTDELPDWYVEKTGTQIPVPDLSEIGVDEALTTETPAESSRLEAATLEPESQLAAGEPETVPNWLSVDAVPAQPTPAEPVLETAAAMPSFDLGDDEPVEDVEMPDWLLEMDSGEPAAVVTSSDEMPDWIQGVELDPDVEVPDWLKQTSEEEAVFTPPDDTPAPIVETAPPPAEPVVPVQAPTSAPPTPAPVVAASPAPVPVSDIDVDATLQSARDKLNNNDIVGSLADYEAVIRANAHLDAIIGELEALVQKDAYKHHAGVYRVLGDGMMRLGRLQDALDTYRKALNLL